MGSIGNMFSVFQNDPQNMPGQGLARTDNYNAETASSEYSKMIRSIYGNQSYMLEQEQQYNPQWLALQQQQAQSAQQGAINLYGQAIPQLAAYQNQANSLTTSGQFNNWVANGRQATDAWRGVNPQAGTLYDSLLKQAQQQVDMGSMLRPEDVYRISQSARRSYADRGLGRSNAAELGEAMQLYGAGENAYQQRMGNAMQMGAASQAFYAPVTSLLTSQSTLPGAAQGWTQYANQLGQAGPVQFNTQAQTGTLNSVYGELQNNNRSQAELETKIGMDQADKWNNWAGFAAGSMCWAAREVFGEENPKWLQFRRWLLADAPKKLRDWYLENGEALAAALKANPEEKGWVREFMEVKIRESNLGLA